MLYINIFLTYCFGETIITSAHPLYILYNTLQILKINKRNNVFHL